MADTADYDSIRQRRNARRRELYRIQRAIETPEQAEEGRVGVNT